MQYKSDKLKHDRNSTYWNADVLIYIIEYDDFNPGSVYVVKDINQKYIEYLSDLRILE